MLHGLGADRRMWSPQVAALMTDHDLLVWDSRGHGRSQWSDPFALESWVRDIDRVLDDQDVARAALVGLSMGGIQAMAYAIARPDRVSALVLANTWAQLTPEDLQRKLDNLPRKAEQLGMEAFAEAYIAGAFADPDSAGARHYRQALAAMSLPAYVASAEACFGAKLAGGIPSIAAPALVLWGDQDDRMPRPLSEFLRDHIPDAALVEVPGAGHVSNLENPDFFSSAVGTFLAEHGALSPGQEKRWSISPPSRQSHSRRLVSCWAPRWTTPARWASRPVSRWPTGPGTWWPLAAWMARRCCPPRSRRTRPTPWRRSAGWPLMSGGP
jgi:pimeloyl-ACP methyl ester carboxylesterase